MPLLAPISENGRPLSSVCSFCGGSQRKIISLDCGQHYICDGCSYRRGIRSVCPLCANWEKHSIENSHYRGEVFYANRNNNGPSIFLPGDPSSVTEISNPYSNPSTAAHIPLCCEAQQSSQAGFPLPSHTPSNSAERPELPIYCNATPLSAAPHVVPLNGSYDPTGVPGGSVLPDVPVYGSSLAPADASLPLSPAYPPVPLPPGSSASIASAGSMAPPMAPPGTSAEAAAELQREIEWSMVPLPVGDTCVSDLPRSAAPLAIPVTSSNHASAALPVYTAIPAPPMAPAGGTRGLFGKLKSSVRSALGRADRAAGDPVSYYRTPSATSATPTGYAARPAVYPPGQFGGIPQASNREGLYPSGEAVPAMPAVPAVPGIPVLKSSKSSSSVTKPANLVLQRQHERLDEETVRRFLMSGN